MKILYFSFAELDIPNACRDHTLGILKGFARQGCRVDALIPRPVHPTPTIGGVRFIRLWPWNFSPTGILWVKLVAAVMMVFLCLLKRYDAIYLRELEVNPGPRVCASLFRIPLFIEINELLVPHFEEIGCRDAFICRVARHQRKDFNRATGLIVPSVPMRRWLMERYGLPADKVHLVLNGGQPPAGDVWDRQKAVAHLGLRPNSFCLGFIGNLYDRYDFETIFTAMQQCRKRMPNLHFLVVGDGPVRRHLERRATDLGLGAHVTFTGYIGSEHLGRYLPAMDLGLVVMNHRDAERYGPITTKVATYGAYRVPVVTTGTTWAGYPPALSQAVFLVSPQAPAALCELFVHLCCHQDERAYKARLFSDYVAANMTWNAVAVKILHIIQASARAQGR